ncbi:MAG TPA: YfiR family protein [Terriglobales bacterium]|nr:YfiR family protein [Terriglobales bacterium]
MPRSENSCRVKRSVQAFGKLTLIAVYLFSVSNAAGQESKVSEYQVKATYLYNFSRFVEWPPQAGPATQSDNFLICVLGDNPFGSTLNDLVANESIEGKSVETKQVLAPADAAKCRVLFISLSEEGRLKTILAGLRNTSVLTVSDLPRFVEKGGMIQFVVEDNHVRFQVNATTAKRAGLLMSSELLKLAVGVSQNTIFGN